MGRIFYLIGKSASGKDTLFEALMRQFSGQLFPVRMYTTRPKRAGEIQGETYHFIDMDAFLAAEKAGKVIESRSYDTVKGLWIYATLDDGQIELSAHSYLMIGTPESYLKTRAYFGEDAMVPLYVEVENGLRLERALARERQQAHPNYAELCRRYLADEKDFSPERLEELKLEKHFDNTDFARCLNELAAAIREKL